VESSAHEIYTRGIAVRVHGCAGVVGGPSHDYFTWALEVFPAILALAALAITYRKFQFTTFVYLLITLHACILFVGGHYTYAEVPLFNWVRDHFHLARNDYDRVEHFAQGFVPALVARRALPGLRRSQLYHRPCVQGKWRNADGVSPSFYMFLYFSMEMCIF
jgi:uncharacterized membrane protein YjdF